VDVQPFDFDGMQVRVVMQDGSPWWVASDVAKALGYRNAPDAIRSLRPEQTRTHSVRTSAGPRQATILSESGLYRLVMRSGRPDAERFQDWVTDEVLPAIRKTGSYSVAKAEPEVALDLRNPLHQAKALAQTLEIIGELQAANAQANETIAELKPPALAWSSMADSRGDYSVADAAKMLARDPSIETGEYRLFKTLVALGMIFHAKDERGRPVKRPYQEHVDAGRLALRMTGTWEHPRTHEREAGSPQIRVTIKGLAYLHKRMGARARSTSCSGPSPRRSQRWRRERRSGNARGAGPVRAESSRRALPLVAPVSIEP
jgi:anti-repressor protein